MGPTHEVLNQPPPLVDFDAVAIDGPLTEGLGRLDPDGLAPTSELGRLAGSAQAQQWATQANTCPPALRTHDRYGNRIDEVEFHPAYHQLMDVAVTRGLHAAPWAAADPSTHLRRAAGFYVWTQAEAGHLCPISMTYAVIPAITGSAVATPYLAGLTSRRYTPGLSDPTVKAGLLAGMGMTEKQGGSDVRSNITRAVGQADGSYRITGHKWFCSAPMNDLFLVLAQLDEGPTCFLVPRVLPGGEHNPFRLQRLKDKLGNRSNASSEVEFDNTVGWRIGEPGRGVRAILPMVTMTRLDCVLGSAAGQRAALVQAVHHARHRSAFGTRLAAAPVMRAVLADLALEVEAATALWLRLAHAVDVGEAAFLRLAVAAAKFWVCKRTPTVVAEALECLGGNGFVEDSGMPRLFRESPLNSIWEGSGNVLALDVLRAVSRDEPAVTALLAEIALAGGADSRFDAAHHDLLDGLADLDPVHARRRAEQFAVLLQASLLLRYAPTGVGDAFCATRLAGGHSLGVLPAAADRDLLLERAFPT